MISSWLAGTGIIGVLAWVYRPDSARQYQREAQLPFDDASRGVAEGAVASEESHG
jgi:hypothetical protein